MCASVVVNADRYDIWGESSNKEIRATRNIPFSVLSKLGNSQCPPEVATWSKTMIGDIANLIHGSHHIINKNHICCHLAAWYCRVNRNFKIGKLIHGLGHVRACNTSKSMRLSRSAAIWSKSQSILMAQVIRTN